MALDAADARSSWVGAQVELETHLAGLLPSAAVLVEQRTNADANAPTPDLTDEQIHQVGALYGRVVGCWARYVHALRQREDPTGAAAVVSLDGTRPATAGSEA